MSVDEARLNQLDALFDAIDDMDPDRFLHFLSSNGRFRFGSAPAVRGHSDIRDAVVEFFSSIESCKHTIDKVLQDEGTLVCEGKVTYARHDESEITLPFVNVFEYEGDLISDYRIYADPTPLHAEQ